MALNDKDCLKKVNCFCCFTVNSTIGKWFVLKKQGWETNSSLHSSVTPKATFCCGATKAKAKHTFMVGHRMVPHRTHSPALTMLFPHTIPQRVGQAIRPLRHSLQLAKLMMMGECPIAQYVCRTPPPPPPRGWLNLHALLSVGQQGPEHLSIIFCRQRSSEGWARV